MHQPRQFCKSQVLPAYGKRDVLIVKSENVLILRPIHSHSCYAESIGQWSIKHKFGAAHLARGVVYNHLQIEYKLGTFSATVPITNRKLRMLEHLAFGEYCRFDTSAWS